MKQIRILPNITDPSVVSGSVSTTLDKIEENLFALQIMQRRQIEVYQIKKRVIARVNLMDIWQYTTQISWIDPKIEIYGQ